jgi:transcriptional regulator with XRE-family HTH domain
MIQSSDTSLVGLVVRQDRRAMAIADSDRERTPALGALRANLIFERAQRRLSQQGLADLAGIGRATLSRIESAAADDVGLSTIQRLADALGIKVTRLLESGHTGPVDDDEIIRRMQDPPSEFVDAREWLKAWDEADAGVVDRYSKAGRPPISR